MLMSQCKPGIRVVWQEGGNGYKTGVIAQGTVFLGSNCVTAELQTPITFGSAVFVQQEFTNELKFVPVEWLSELPSRAEYEPQGA